MSLGKRRRRRRRRHAIQSNEFWASLLLLLLLQPLNDRPIDPDLESRGGRRRPDVVQGRLHNITVSPPRSSLSPPPPCRHAQLYDLFPKCTAALAVTTTMVVMVGGGRTGLNLLRIHRWTDGQREGWRRMESRFAPLP